MLYYTRVTAHMNDPGSSNTNIDLATTSTVVSSLQRVVADFYGPQCTQTLLTSQTGKAVVTSDGLTIVEALHASHPITELVFKSLKSCHSVTLDGSKTFLIYLANFLVHLDEEIRLGKFCHSGTNVATNKEAVEKRGIVCARKCVRQLKRDVLPKICQALQIHSDALSHKILLSMTRIEVSKNIIQTSLMPHYNPKLCDHFTRVLSSSFPKECDIESFKEVSNFLVDNFYDINIKVTDKPYGESTHIEPFILDREITVKHDDLFSSSQPAMLILKGNIDGSEMEEDSQETFHIKDSRQIVNLIHARRKMVEEFAHRCSCQKIDLLLCTGGVPGYSLDIFRRKNISVIANVIERDAEMLEQLSGKLSIDGTYDAISERNIIRLSGIYELIIGGRKYVQLKLCQMTHPINHLIVCAPTVGLCDQLGINLQKGLNAVKMCLNSQEFGHLNPFYQNCAVKENNEKVGKSLKGLTESLDEKEPQNSSDKNDRPDIMKGRHSPSLGVCEKLDNLSLKEINQAYNDLPSMTKEWSIIEGGGAFEVLVHKLLKNFTDTSTDTNLSLMCVILQKTMISLVKKLYDNTSIQSEGSRGFLEVKTVLEEKIKGGELWGLNRRGIPCCIAEKGVIEPLPCKIHILSCALDLVDQLLGIDRIVSVRKLDCGMDDTSQ